ncbi:MAG: glycerol-3-phosphate 1-O-acyltransferase PlsY [Limisphaerales bacterium]
MEFFSYIAVAIAAYLLGSIPTGYLVAKAKGIDIRSVGSGNIGATNVFRILGKKAGIFVLTVDALKGFVAAWLLPIIAVRFHPDAETSAALFEWLRIVAGISAILGHNYTCWLNFKGGKGIATSAGVLIALFPQAFVVCLVVWIVVFLVSKYVSLASILAAACLPFAAWFFQSSTRMIVVAVLMGGLAIYKHKANIQRLMNGTENRFGKKKTETPK